MITSWLVVRLLAGLVALGVSIHLARWQRRRRAEWKAYDEAYEAETGKPAVKHIKRLPR